MGENFALILFLLCCSAFFCFSEGALFSLSRPQLESISKQGGRVSATIEKLLSNSHKLITTILLADEVFNIAYSSVIGLTARKHLQDTPEQTVALISLAIASPTLLVFGEIIPKTAGVKFPRTISRAVAVPLYFFHLSVFPIRWGIMLISGFFTRALGANEQNGPEEASISSEELEILVDMGSEEGVLNEVEKSLADGFFRLETLQAQAIMTPAVDCFTLADQVVVRDAVSKIRNCGHSRIPVYDGERDNITGILYGKDILRGEARGLSHDSRVTEILREPYFIPRSKPAGALLREFQSRRIHMAIVVDEYGRFDGLVTMEDILEEIFGEIEDEKKTLQKTAPELSGKEITIPGAMRIEEFNEDSFLSATQGEEIENMARRLRDAVVAQGTENGTVGGFVLDLFGRLPEEDEKTSFCGLVFTVKKKDGNRISSIGVEVDRSGEESRGV